jgi:hypothetical protein
LGITRQGAWKTLRQFEAAEFVREAKLPITGRTSYALWGITAHGLAYAWNLDETPEERPVFEPSRIAVSVLPHHVDLQRARIKAEHAGWTKWKRGERLGFKTKNRPDAIARDNAGIMVAIEIERTIKTIKRYRQIMAAHLQEIKNEQWARVEYVCPSESFCKRLERIFRSIDYVVIGNQRVKLSEKHHDRFAFTSINNWPILNR